MAFFGRNYRFHGVLTTVLLSSLLKAFVLLRKDFDLLDKQWDIINESLKTDLPKARETFRRYIYNIHAGVIYCTKIHDNLLLLLVRDDLGITKAYLHLIKELEIDERERSDDLGRLRRLLEKEHAEHDKRMLKKTRQKITDEERAIRMDSKTLKRVMDIEKKVKSKFNNAKHDKLLAAKYRLRGTFSLEKFKEFDLRSSHRLAQKMIYQDIKLDWVQKDITIDEVKLSKAHLDIVDKLYKEANKLLKIEEFESIKTHVLFKRLVDVLNKAEPLVEQLGDETFKKDFKLYSLHARKAAAGIFKQVKRLEIDTYYTNKKRAKSYGRVA